MEAIDCKLMEMYLLDFFVFVQLVISISMYATAECIEVNIIHVPVYACELEEQFRLRWASGLYWLGVNYIQI